MKRLAIFLLLVGAGLEVPTIKILSPVKNPIQLKRNSRMSSKLSKPSRNSAHPFLLVEQVRQAATMLTAEPRLVMLILVI